MKNTLKTIGILTLAAVSVSACASTSKDRLKYQSYSCMQLAEEYGKQKAIRKAAQFEDISTGLDFLLADDDDDLIVAGVEGAVSTVSGDNAKKRVNVLSEVLNQKGC